MGGALPGQHPRRPRQQEAVQPPSAEQRHREAAELRDLVQQTSIGQEFGYAGDTYVRHATKKGATSTSYVTKVEQTKRIDTDWQVVTTFMTWAIVEVFRYTGVRIEELLELNHLSIRQYRKPDGTVLPLLQIAPSKTDEERVLPCSPSRRPPSPGWSSSSCSTARFPSASAATTTNARTPRRCRTCSSCGKPAGPARSASARSAAG